MKFIDIGANLTSGQYSGYYWGGKTKHHDSDVETVIQRALDNNVEHMVVTIGSLKDLKEAKKLFSNEALSFTIGIHPTRAKDVANNIEKVVDGLLEEYNRNPDRYVAVGELGLDYDRLQFSPIEDQKIVFEAQFKLANETRLPLFLHNRNSTDDFIEILQRNIENGNVHSYCIVHSFTGTNEDLEKFLAFPQVYFSINGCSFKTQEQCDVMKNIPLERLMLETDCPYCPVKRNSPLFEHVQTHFPASNSRKYDSSKCVKGRVEPCHIIHVCEAFAGLTNRSPSEIAETCYENTKKVFNL
eukprot:TRINITY_DN3279_c5_g2_i1.p1 TRINITY_DN3279_c5_g2~~TRINITY_DN3279_c5_g2_i1.p1  ORF type:complete len:299 (+),score=91.89 TRINITY_DN3279_c5_g2_i1:496-1392(+)